MSRINKRFTSLTQVLLLNQKGVKTMKTFQAKNKYDKEEYAFVQFWPNNDTSQYFHSFDVELFCGIIPKTREAVLLILDIDGFNYIPLKHLPYCEDIITKSYVNAFYKWNAMIYGQTYAINPSNLDLSSVIPEFIDKEVYVHENANKAPF